MLRYGNERMRELRMARVENGESPSEGCTENQLHYVVLTQVGFSAGRSRPVRLLLAAAWWPSAAVSTWLVEVDAIASSIISYVYSRPRTPDKQRHPLPPVLA